MVDLPEKGGRDTVVSGGGVPIVTQKVKKLQNEEVTEEVIEGFI